MVLAYKIKTGRELLQDRDDSKEKVYERSEKVARLFGADPSGLFGRVMQFSRAESNLTYTKEEIAEKLKEAGIIGSGLIGKINAVFAHNMKFPITEGLFYKFVKERDNRYRLKIEINDAVFNKSPMYGEFEV